MAISYAIDRDAINQAVLLGKGEPNAGLWPKSSVFYEKSLEPFVKRDVAKAKALLKQVGVPDGYAMDMSVSQGVSNIQQFAEVVQGELADVGLKVTLKPTPDIVRDFYVGKQTAFTPSLWIRPGLQKLTRQFTPGQAATICNYSDPTLTGYMNDLAKLDPSDPKAKQLWSDAQKFIVSTNMLAAYVAFQPQLFAFRTDKLGGDYGLISASGFTPYPDLTSIYVKK
jgi:peptide/nickel transport system substrate-binding protein